MNQSYELSFCRLCLYSSGSLLNIFKDNSPYEHFVSESMQDLLQLKVVKEDRVPWLICHSCVVRLSAFREFKARCYRSKMVFDNILRQRTSSNCVEEEEVLLIHDGVTGDKSRVGAPAVVGQVPDTDDDTADGRFLVAQGSHFGAGNSGDVFEAEDSSELEYCWCNMCGGEFMSYRELKAHVKLCQSMLQSSSRTTVSQCGSRDEIKKDLRSSPQCFDPNLCCARCRRSFSSKEHLIQHIEKYDFKCMAKRKERDIPFDNSDKRKDTQLLRPSRGRGGDAKMQISKFAELEGHRSLPHCDKSVDMFQTQKNMEKCTKGSTFRREMERTPLSTIATGTLMGKDEIETVSSGSCEEKSSRRKRNMFPQDIMQASGYVHHRKAVKKMSRGQKICVENARNIGAVEQDIKAMNKSLERWDNVNDLVESTLGNSYQSDCGDKRERVQSSIKFGRKTVMCSKIAYQDEDNICSAAVVDTRNFALPSPPSGDRIGGITTKPCEETPVTERNTASEGNSKKCRKRQTSVEVIAESVSKKSPSQMIYVKDGRSCNAFPVLSEIPFIDVENEDESSDKSGAECLNLKSSDGGKGEKCCDLLSSCVGNKGKDLSPGAVNDEKRCSGNGKIYLSNSQSAVKCCTFGDEVNIDVEEVRTGSEVNRISNDSNRAQLTVVGCLAEEKMITGVAISAGTLHSGNGRKDSCNVQSLGKIYSSGETRNADGETKHSGNAVNGKNNDSATINYVPSSLPVDASNRGSEIDSYACNHCLKCYKTKLCLRNHIVKCHLPYDPRNCLVCHRVFSSIEELEEHSRSHPKMNRYYCTVCQTAFRFRSQLKRHIKEIHGAEMPCICGLCHNGFANRVDLGLHQTLVHVDEEKRYCCATCGKSYTNKYTHKLHLEVCQLKTQTFECKVCGKHLSTRGSLSNHARVHTESRKTYRCTMCPRLFSYASNRNIHIRDVHMRLRPHECGICNKRFATKARLRLHYRSHSEERPFECPCCPKAFKERKKMKLHLRIIHQKTVEPS